MRRVIGFATYLLHVHDAASRREVLRGDITLDPALDFEESSLCFGRSTVNFIGQYHVCKDRSLYKSHLTPIRRLFENFTASNIGEHEIGSKLYTLKTQIEELRE